MTGRRATSRAVRPLASPLSTTASAAAELLCIDARTADRLPLATGTPPWSPLVGTRLLIGAPPDAHRPTYPRGRPRGPHGQGRHADHGRRRHRAGGLCGYPGVEPLRRACYLDRTFGRHGRDRRRRTVADDWIKIRNERNLGPQQAIRPSLLVRSVLLVILWRTNVHTTISFGRFDDLGWTLGKWVWVAWAVLVIFARPTPSTSPTASTAWRPGRPSRVLGLRDHRLRIFRHLGHVPDQRRTRSGGRSRRP